METTDKDTKFLSNWLQLIDINRIEFSKPSKSKPILFDSNGLLGNGKKRSLNGGITGPDFIFPPENKVRENLTISSAPLQIATFSEEASLCVAVHLKYKVESVVRNYKRRKGDGTIFENFIQNLGNGEKVYKTATQSIKFKECYVRLERGIIHPNTNSPTLEKLNQSVSQDQQSFQSNKPSSSLPADQVGIDKSKRTFPTTKLTTSSSPNTLKLEKRQRSLFHYFKPTTPTPSTPPKHSRFKRNADVLDETNQIKQTTPVTPKRLFSRTLRQRILFSSSSPVTRSKSCKKEILISPPAKIPAKKLQSKSTKLGKPSTALLKLKGKGRKALLSSTSVLRSPSISPLFIRLEKKSKRNSIVSVVADNHNYEKDIFSTVKVEPESNIANRSSYPLKIVSLPKRITGRILNKYSSVFNTKSEKAFETSLESLRSRFIFRGKKKIIRVEKLSKEKTEIAEETKWSLLPIHQNQSQIPVDVKMTMSEQGILQSNDNNCRLIEERLKSIQTSTTMDHSYSLKMEKDLEMDMEISLNTLNIDYPYDELDEDTLVEDVLTLEDDFNSIHCEKVFDEVQASWKSFFELYSDISLSSLVSPEDFESLIMEVLNAGLSHDDQWNTLCLCN